MTGDAREGRDLSELPGIGKDLAGKIGTLAKTGHLPLLDSLRRHACGRERL